MRRVKRSEVLPDMDDGVTDLQEAILGLLEDAGISQVINDQIMTLVAKGEAELDNLRQNDRNPELDRGDWEYHQRRSDE